MQMTEQFILIHAPNPAAAENGRKLSKKGSFGALGRTEDGNTYWGECAGSGSKPYRVSVDFALSPEQPTCRCSCPSRQFPCKHALGLMFEILSGKAFAVGDMPADLAEKKAKQEAKAAKKNEAGGEDGAKTKKPRKTNTAAQKKKLEKQLEGLDVAEKMTDELLSAGISSLAGTSAQSMDKIAKELGNYYLTGPQTSFERIALTVRKIQQDKDHAELYYAEALRILIALRATVKKSREFLQNKLEAEHYTAEDSVLYEALGGVWRLEDLQAIGAFRENAKLVQLSFDVSFDEAKKEYVERGFWLDISCGKLVQTLNLRPLKAVKYIKAEDSCFELLEIATLYQYPGDNCPRVRWESFTSRPLTDVERGMLRTFASQGIADVIKTAKGQFKNTLLPKFMPALVPIASLGRAGDVSAVEDAAGTRLELRDRREDGESHACVRGLNALPVQPQTGDALFGLVFYDEADRHICLHPYSLITAEQVIRLQY